MMKSTLFATLLLLSSRPASPLGEKTIGETATPPAGEESSICSETSWFSGPVA